MVEPEELGPHLLSNSLGISKLMDLLVREYPATLGTRKIVAGRWPTTGQGAAEMLCCAASAHLEVVVAFLDLARGKYQDIPHPGTFKSLASGFPCPHIPIIDLEHGLATYHARLGTALAADKS